MSDTSDSDWSSADAYYRFMDFSEEQLRTRYRRYAAMFSDCTRVADLGCGTGVFLDLIKSSGVEGIGFDPDPGQVQRCIDKGLTAEQGYSSDLAKRYPATFDGIFCSHVVEHLGTSELDELLSDCHAALQVGGKLIVVTPNPEALHVHLLEFWRDPTHVRLYSKEALAFLMDARGFEVVESKDNLEHATGREFMTNALRPGKWWTRLIMRPVIPRLERILQPLGLDKGNEIYLIAKKV